MSATNFFRIWGKETFVLLGKRISISALSSINTMFGTVRRPDLRKLETEKLSQNFKTTFLVDIVSDFQNHVAELFK